MAIKQENLITLTGNYLPGQRFVMIDGTLVPVGFGTPYIPGSTIVTPADKGVYYKCASVDTDNSKWTGYKASQLEDGTWTFAEEITTGLTFTEITPEKDSIYSYDALVKVKLWDGNIFPVSGQLWGYQVGELLEDNTLTATTTGSISADSDGAYTLGDGKYFELPENILLGNSARSFVFHANLSEGSQIQFVDAGNQSTSQMFGLLWGYSSGYVGYHFWSNDGSSWAPLSYGEHVVVFVYDGSTLTCYADGSVIGTHSTTLDTQSNNRYRIGQYVIDDWHSMGEWKSKFCAVYDRTLTSEEVTALTDYVKGL